MSGERVDDKHDELRSQAKNQVIRPGGIIQSIARLVLGVLFSFHGAATLFGIFGKHAAHFGVWPSWWAALIELLGGLLVAVGLGTRVAALLCSGAMAYAYFTVHQHHALLPLTNGGEPAALYAWIFLLIAAIGAGPISVDAMVRRRRPPADVSPSIEDRENVRNVAVAD